MFHHATQVIDKLLSVARLNFRRCVWTDPKVIQRASLLKIGIFLINARKNHWNATDPSRNIFLTSAEVREYF